MRIPVGARTIFEHMATAIDFVHELRRRRGADRIEYINEMIRNSYDVDLLRYHALTHRAAHAVALEHTAAGRLQWRSTLRGVSPS